MIVLQTLLKGIVGADKVALGVQSGSFAAPALGPVRLDLNRPVGVGDGVVPVLLVGVGG